MPAAHSTTITTDDRVPMGLYYPAHEYHISLQDGSTPDPCDLRRAMTQCELAEIEWRKLLTTRHYSRSKHYRNILLYLSLAMSWQMSGPSVPLEVRNLGQLMVGLRLRHIDDPDRVEALTRRVIYDVIDGFDPTIPLSQNIDRVLRRCLTS